MSKIRSEFSEVEMFITTDDIRFTCEDSAIEHQEYIDAREYFESVVDISVKTFVKKTRPYLIEQL